MNSSTWITATETHQHELLMQDILALVPSRSAAEIEAAVTGMSRRTGISTTVLLTGLYEDLLLRIPFPYTAVGRICPFSGR